MRTRESETKANVEFWNNRGIALSEDEARKAIEALPEVEGFDFYLVIPKRVAAPAIYEMLGKIVPTETLDEQDFRYHTIQRENTERTYAVATRFQQGSGFVCPCYSEYRHCQTPLDWESISVHFMIPVEYMVMAMRWFEETGTYLDDSSSTTIFPRTRMTTGYIPEMGFTRDTWRDRGWVFFSHEPLQYRSGRAARVSVREVVAEGTPCTDPIPYNAEPPFRL